MNLVYPKRKLPKVAKERWLAVYGQDLSRNSCSMLAYYPNVSPTSCHYENLDVLRRKQREVKRPAVAGNLTQDTWLVQPVLCHWATTTGQPPAPTILYMYCIGGIEMPLSHTRQPLLSELRTLLRIDQKILSIRREFSSKFWWLTTCAVHIEDCWGWWLSGCHSSVAEHWLHKPGVVLGLIAGDCWPFHFPLFLPQNTLSQCEARVLSTLPLL